MREDPSRAEQFVDSIGVVTHLSQNPYLGQRGAVVNLLTASGIRHVRDGVIGSLIPAVTRLASSGIRTTFTTDLAMPDSEIESWPKTVGYAFEAYEGPNEPNYLPGNWAARTRAFMRRLYADVRGTPALAGTPILAPCVSKGQAQLGDLSSLVDYGNMHDYFATYNPGTLGWGYRHPPFGVYGSLAYNMNLVRQISGSKPIIATETGYGSTPTGSPNYLDNVTAAKYITRTYFVHFNAGVPRTFVYEFLDQDGSGRPFTNNGFVDLNLHPKPSYKALQAIIAFLADRNIAFKPAPLTYQVTGSLNNIRHTLLQKTDGTYYLALWIEAPSWRNGHRYAIPSRTLTITTQSTMHAASVFRLDDGGNASVVRLSGMPGRSVQLSVTDRISIVRLVP